MFVFQWEVSQEGYQWVETPCGRFLDEEAYRDDTKCWLLTLGKPPGADVLLRLYQPLEEHNALFRIFAETPITQESIKAFADTYGMLTLGELDAYYLITNSAAKLGSSFVGIGEQLLLWEQEITAMREAVMLWDLGQDGEREKLSHYVTWDGDNGVAYQLPDSEMQSDDEKTLWKLIARKDYHPERLQWVTPGEVLTPVKFYLQDVINAHQAGRVSPQMFWSPGENALRERVVPHNLLGALWLQLALAIDGERQYRRCLQCGQWFEVERSDRRFCSNTCRWRTFRDRKESAAASLESAPGRSRKKRGTT